MNNKTLTGIVELGGDVYIEDNSVYNVSTYYGDEIDVNTILTDTANITGNLKVEGTADIADLSIKNETITGNLDVSGNVNIDNYTLFANCYSGNIGIGTSNTMTRLQFSTTAEPKISFYQYSSTQYYGIGYTSTQINHHVAGSSGSHVFYQGGLNGNGTELFRIKGIGNVSIGVGSNPIGKLNVKGDANITGNLLVVGNVVSDYSTFNTANITTANITNLILGSSISIDTANITTANINNGYITGNLDIYGNINKLNVVGDANIFTGNLLVQQDTGAIVLFGNCVSANIGISTLNTYTTLTFNNVVEPKISLYGNSSNIYGFSYSSGQLNYVSQSEHVFYLYGNNNDGVEQLRISSGNITCSNKLIANSFSITSNSSIGNLSILPNHRTDTTCSNVAQLGSYIYQDVSLFQYNFTTTPQYSYSFTASSTNTSYVYNAFGTETATYWRSNNAYNSSGVYTGSSDIIADASYEFGEYVYATLPTTYILRKVSLKIYKPSATVGCAKELVICGYNASSGWEILQTYTALSNSTHSVTIYLDENWCVSSRLLILCKSVYSNTNSAVTWFQVGEIQATGFKRTIREQIYVPQCLEVGGEFQKTDALETSNQFVVNGSSNFNGDIYGNGCMMICQPCCKVSRVYTGGLSFTNNTTSILDGTTAEFDIKPWNKKHKGWDKTLYNFPINGYYRVSMSARFSVTGTTGLRPRFYRWSTSAYSNILVDDGIIWAGVDSDGTRCIGSFDDIVYGTTDLGILPCVYDTTTVMWCTMSINFIGVAG